MGPKLNFPPLNKTLGPITLLFLKMILYPKSQNDIYIGGAAHSLPSQETYLERSLQEKET